MSTTTLQSYVRPGEGSLRYAGIDALNDASRTSSVEFAQAGRGELGAEYRTASLARVHFSAAVYSQSVVCRGAPSPGTCFVGIPTGGETSPHPVGTVAGSECTFLPEGREYLQTIPGRHRILVVVLDQMALRQATETYWGLPLHRIALGGVYRTRDGAFRSRLLAQVEGLAASVASSPRDGAHREGFVRELEAELFDSLLSAALPDGSVREQPDRQRLARRAASILGDDLGSPDGLGTVASELRTTLRTLELGFQEVYGMSPRAFRHVLRLQRARDDLRRAAPDQTVAQAAMRNGLVHLGRFSVDYRRVFGESPRETLRAARRRAA